MATAVQNAIDTLRRGASARVDRYRGLLKTLNTATYDIAYYEAARFPSSGGSNWARLSISPTSSSRV